MPSSRPRRESRGAAPAAATSSSTRAREDLSASTKKLTWGLLKTHVGGMDDGDAKQLLSQLDAAGIRTVGRLYVEAELIRIERELCRCWEACRC